jgi:hypothetical protein
VRILLDTHTFYWFIEGDPQLSALASSTISDPANEVLLSPSSYWEIAVKVSMGKWRLHRPYDEFIDIGWMGGVGPSSKLFSGRHRTTCVGVYAGRLQIVAADLTGRTPPPSRRQRRRPRRQ